MMRWFLPLLLVVPFTLVTLGCSKDGGDSPRAEDSPPADKFKPVKPQMGDSDHSKPPPKVKKPKDKQPTQPGPGAE